MKQWQVYLSGEIHSNWREEIRELAEAAKLPVQFLAPVTDHTASDSCGEAILGAAPDAFWNDHQAARINAIRTRTAIDNADVVVVRFGDKYRQWNAAFDAGCAVTLGKPLITLHDEPLNHALKEVNAAALATTRTPTQVVDVLRYVIQGELPG